MLKLCQCCCRGIVCNHCRPPCCPLLFLSESLCDYRVQGRWGLTWINKGLWSRGGSDVTCPADAKKHRCTRSKAQLPFLFTFNRHHHWDRMMPRLMLKWITTRLQAREAALLCKAAEKDLKDFKGVFFFFFFSVWRVWTLSGWLHTPHVHVQLFIPHFGHWRGCRC